MEKLATGAVAPNVTPDTARWIRYFAPSWFAAVMGTGVLALGTAALARSTPALAPLAALLHWFNVALFAVLLVPWTLRWFVARREATAALSHPVVASFVPTIAIALLVLAAQFLQIAGRPDVALASFRLSHAFPLPGIFGIGVIAFTLLLGFWSVTLVRSVRGVADGSVFQPH